MEINELVVRQLKADLGMYDSIKKAITKRKNQLRAMHSDKPKSEVDSIIKVDPLLVGTISKAGKEKTQGLKQIKDRISRDVGNQLECWPIWTEWAKNVPGVGPAIAGNLISMYYYKFVPVCKECNTDLVEFKCPKCDNAAKGDGVLKTRIELRDFPNVAKWWAFLGMHCTFDNKTQEWRKPKLKSGVQANWSSKGRALGYDVSDQFNRQKDNTPYGAFLLDRKKKRENSGKTKLHILMMARNEAAKLFLSHWWHVARELEGKSTRGVYADVVLEHTGIIPPYYWTVNGE